MHNAELLSSSRKSCGVLCLEFVINLILSEAELEGFHSAALVSLGSLIFRGRREWMLGVRGSWGRMTARLWAHNDLQRIRS